MTGEMEEFIFVYLLAKASKLVCCDGLWGRGGEEVHSVGDGNERVVVVNVVPI